jgi:hypothetical protein
MADIKKIIKDLQGDFSGSNDDQFSGIQLLKGLAGSDEDLANKFMKELDKATTKISKSLLDSKDESVDKDASLQEEEQESGTESSTSEANRIEVTQDAQITDNLALEPGDVIEVIPGSDSGES